MDIEISPRNVLNVLLSVIGFLLLANLLSIFWIFGTDHEPVYALIKLFHFGKEGNLPTLFSSFQLIVSGLLLWTIGAIHRTNGAGFVPWFLLAVIFMFLAIDETAQIHERLINPIRTTFGFTGLFYFAWVVPYGVAVLVFAIVFSRFLIGLPTETTWRFIISGVIYVGGAIGFEMLGARHFEIYGSLNVTYSMFQTCEELMEMLGIALFVYALLAYLSTQFQYFRCTLKTRIAGQS